MNYVPKKLVILMLTMLKYIRNVFYFLLILSIVFCAIGLKFLTFKTGNHENDFIFKIMGW